jgi:hypothetical protein
MSSFVGNKEFVFLRYSLKITSNMKQNVNTLQIKLVKHKTTTLEKKLKIIFKIKN